MSLGLLLPSALLALLALAIPLLLHLVRQTEQVRIEFAALRWLVARAQPRKRPRFSEWLLLVLRLLLLALLALWLAQPVLSGRPDLRAWVVVDPGINATQLAAHQAANLPKDAQWHWLAPGFPSIEQPAPRSTTSTSISSLLRELDATLPRAVALTAIVPEQFDATDAQQARLGRLVTWAPVPGTTSFNAAIAPTPMRLAAFVDAKHQPSLAYLRAAAIAWATQAKPPAASTTLREIAGMDAVQPSDTHLLWLASAEPPPQQQQWVRNGGVILLAQDSVAASLDWQDAHVAWRSADGTPLALRLLDAKGAWIRMLVPFNAESLPALLEPDFPRELQDALQLQAPTATRAWADSVEPVVHAHSTQAAQALRPLGDPLALLIAVLFGIERWFAMSMRRFRSA